MAFITTTIRLDGKLYEQLRREVFERKRTDPQVSMSKLVAFALLEYFDKDNADAQTHV